MSVGGMGTPASRQVSKKFLEGWHRKFSANVRGLVKKPSTVLLYRSIVLQHVRKLTLGYTGYTKVKNIFQLHVLNFFGDNVYCCFILSDLFKFCQS